MAQTEEETHRRGADAEAHGLRKASEGQRESRSQQDATPQNRNCDRIVRRNSKHTGPYAGPDTAHKVIAEQKFRKHTR
jgi:hypothetical protein